MRVVFTHKNSFGFTYSDNPIPRSLLVLGAMSWKRHYPEDTVVLYCDQDTRRYLDSLPREYVAWDEINLIDFEKVFESGQYDKRMWCWPRIYTAFLEKEPCIILDIDVVLCGRFKPEGRDNCFWATTHHYSRSETSKIETCPILNMVLAEKFACGGLMYHPDPDKLHELSSDIVAFQRIPSVNEFIGKFGYNEYACIFEQGYPVKYYRDSGVETVRFEQTDALENIGPGKTLVYHAMGSKYVRVPRKQYNLISSVLQKSLYYSPEQIREFCKVMGVEIFFPEIV